MRKFVKLFFQKIFHFFFMRAYCVFLLLKTCFMAKLSERMTSNFQKFGLLMWKNWLLHKRKPLQTVVEILAPVIFSVFLVLIRSLIDPEDHVSTIYQPFCPLPMPTKTCSYSDVQMSIFQGNSLPNITLVYSPQNNELDALIKNHIKYLENIANFKVVGLENSEKLEQHFATPEGNNTFAGIQFPDGFDFVKNPENLEISLRFPSELRFMGSALENNGWITYLLYPIYQMAGPRFRANNTGAAPFYYKEGFLALQQVVTYLLIELQNGTTSFTDLPFLTMQRYPYPEYTDDPLLQALISFVGIIIMLSFVYTCINTVKMITTEKEKQLKEAMKIMGLSNWLHWSAWFVQSFILLFISVILIVVLIKLNWYPGTEFSVFTYADASVMLLFMVLYVCATITFCFAISVFFSKANTAAQIGAVLWFLSYSPYLFLQQSYDSLSLSTKLLSSLGSNTAMAFGFQVMLMFEGNGEGIQWNSIWEPGSPSDTLTLGHIMMMLILDTFIYLLVALYFEAVFPGEYGVPQKWYFFVTPSFWSGKKSTDVVVEDYPGETTHDPREFEKEPDNLHAGIRIKNLRRDFKKKTAVRNLSLNMYENQITVLLGHNGAGKTTTMSMLTGLLRPTSGTAVISGYDIRNNMLKIRDSLGLCPQHNIIFEDMTVSEHLYFFSKLKGLESKQIDNEIKKYLTLLELEPKADKLSKTLSGGMKRKLCVGMALCGNSKVVMLDEPTAGMDPSARRALWDLIQTQKTGRTILLTTHFMDEADLLGDRIAIMAGGELQCCGSSFFLKKRYGAGYYLVMEKSPKCQPNSVTQFLSGYIPNIKIESNVGSELTYLLEESNSSKFRDMLGELERHSAELGIVTFGISLTTLEEVFMKVGADHGQEELNDLKETNGFTNNHAETLNPDKSDKTTINMSRGEFLTGFPLIKNQIIAMLMKRCLSILRSYITYLIALFLPILFLIIAIIVGRNNINVELPALEITLDSYRDPVTLYDLTKDGVYNATFVKTLQEGNFEVKHVENITSEMLTLTQENPSKVRQSYLAGASFEGIKTILFEIANISVPFDFTVINAWFNNDPYHTPPLALGLVLNSIYKAKVSEKSKITFINHPLPYTAQSKVQQYLHQNTMGFQISFNIGFSMAFVSSIFVLFYVRERVSKSKHLQFVSGVKVFVFWCTNYVVDLIVHIIIVIGILVTLVAFQEDGFKTAAELGRVFSILLYFGMFVLPLTYLAAYLFEVPSTGFVRMSLFGIFTGVACFMVVQVLMTPNLDLVYVADSLHWVFLFFPHYSLASGLQDTFTLYATNEVCKEMCKYSLQQTCDPCAALPDYCCDIGDNYFKWAKGGIGRNVFFSYMAAIILFGIVLIKEYRLFAILSYKIRSRMGDKFPEEIPKEDSDVLAERKHIRDTQTSELFRNYKLVMKDVTKYYGKFRAVNGICLGVKKNECFGLLGINGAGKTTTFKMMTGDVKMTYGEAWVEGFSVKNQMKSVQKLIGYCPQFDAVLNDLTAKETLTMYCLIRGIPEEENNYIADKLSKEFDFQRHLNKQVKALSGGNKRKLSTALALIGDPEIIYLDEPTTGMDPATKRFLWNALCKVRDTGKCLVLTSHSMEECEALCTRLAIMVNGNFKCLGSTQHLKNKFSEGYTMTIKVRKTDEDKNHINTEDIEQYVRQHFPTSVLREKHQEMLTYYVPDKNLSWSRMFGILEDGKNRLNIEDYTLGQTSLEQVFLSFTKYDQ